MIFNEMGDIFIKQTIGKMVMNGFIGLFIGVVMMATGLLISDLSFIISAGAIIFTIGFVLVGFVIFLMMHGSLPKSLSFLVSKSNEKVSKIYSIGLTYSAEDRRLKSERAGKFILSKKIGEHTNYDWVNSVIIDMSDKMKEKENN